MFADFLSRLANPGPQRLPDPDARLALTALLVRIARADGYYAPAERTRIDSLLETRYGLTPDAAQALRAEGEAPEAEAPDTVRFTRAIKDAVPYEDREAVIEAMWAVVLVDGERDQDEDTLLRLTANLLGVSDRDSNMARLRVEKRKG